MAAKARRRFIRNSLAAVSGIGILPAISACSNRNSDLSQLFVHHVFFWLKEPDNKEAMDKCKHELNRLDTIETIRFKHVVEPADTDREVIDNSYQFSLLLIFDNKEGHDIYQEHEKHKIFIEECKDIWKNVLVYDSWNL